MQESDITARGKLTQKKIACIIMTGTGTCVPSTLIKFGGIFLTRKSCIKTTSSKIASKASSILKDNRYSKTSKSVAGSALAQAKCKKK